jgi:hypothetical protein
MQRLTHNRVCDCDVRLTTSSQVTTKRRQALSRWCLLSVVTMCPTSNDCNANSHTYADANGYAETYPYTPATPDSASLGLRRSAETPEIFRHL